MTNVIEAVLTANDKSYTSTMQKAMGVTDSFAKKVAGGIGFGALLRIGGQAVDTIGRGVKSLVGDIDSTNAAWKSFRSNMEMIGRGAEVDKVKKELQDFAAQTVYTSADMAQTYSQLAAVGTKDTAKLVQGFGMVAAAAENPQQAMKTLSTQATQMAAKPQVAWQDFKLMLEQTPAGISQVAKAMDMTTTELVQNVQDGKVATEDFFNAIIKAADAKELQQMAKQYKTIGQAADGVRATLVNRLAPSWEKINQVGIKRMGDLMTAFAGINADALADKVGVAVEKVDGFLDQLIQKVEQAGGLGPVLASLGSALAGIAVAPQLGSAAKALTLFNKSLFGMNAGTAALAALNPAVLFGAILVGAGLLGTAFGPQIDAIISDMTTKGPKIITSLGESITSALPTLMATGAEILTNLINAIAANIPAIIQQGTNILTSLVQGVIAAIPTLIPAAFNAIGQFAIGIATALPQLITQGLQLIVALVQGIASNLPQLSTSAVTAIAQFAVGIVQNLPQILQCGLDILQALVRGVISGITQIPTMVKSIFGVIKDAITGNTSEVESAGQTQGQVLTDSVASSAANNFSAMQTVGTETAANFGSGLNSGISGISLDTGAISSSFDSMAGTAQSSGTSIGTSFGSGVQSGVNSTPVNTSNVTSAMQQAAPQAAAAGKQTGTQFNAGLKSVQGQITATSKSLATAAASQLRSGYGKAYSCGASISHGLAAGMRSALGSVQAAAAQLAAAADRAMRAKAQVHSPSKVSAKVGAFISKGLAVGMLKQKAVLTKAGKNTITAVLKAMQNAVKKGDAGKKAENIVKNSLKRIENLQKTYQQKLDAINDKKQAMIDNLTDLSLFKSKNGNVIFADFATETSKLKQLASNINKLKDKIPRGLLDEITAMDTADQLKYTNALLDKSEAEIKAYGKTYTAMQNQAKSMSKTYYQGDIEKNAQNYANAIAKEFQTLSKQMGTIGKNALKGFISGMNSQKKSLSSVTKTLVNQVIATAKKKLKIKSPSRVFEEIGAYTGEGFALGLDKTQADVQASIDNMLSAADFNKQMANKRFSGSLQDEYDYNIAARYEIVVPLEVNGREFARATANDMQSVINQNETYANRKRGIR